MAKASLGTVLDDLRRSLGRQEEAGLTDAELLEGFLSRRDEAAFEALLRRHGSMVLGVCRRILGNEADAEDAFQATFLVLVRKAGSIRPRGMVGNWLYGVAHTTALKARAMSSKRRAKEREAARPDREVAEQTWEQLYALLDLELKALPDRYRAAIVLCDLEGQSIKEAARQLGCPQGTVGTRLARGRTMLSRRLARHGLTLSGSGIATVLAQTAEAAGVPPLLMSSTINAAGLLAAGQAVTSARVAALTEQVVKAMLLTKLRLALLVVLGMSVIGAMAGLLTYPSVNAQQPDTRQETRPQLPPEGGKKARGDGEVAPKGHSGMVRHAVFSPDSRVLVTGGYVLKPDGIDEVILWDVKTEKPKRALKLPMGGLYQLAFSLDSRTLAIGTDGQIELRNADNGELKRVLKGHQPLSGVFSLAFSRDSKTLASGGNRSDRTVRVWEVETGKLKHTLRGHGDEVVGLAFSPDGKTLASVSGMGDARICLWDVATGKLKVAHEVDRELWQGMPLAFSPDGRIFAVGRGAGVAFWDTQTGKLKDRLITASEPQRILQSLAFSPNGKLVAGGRSSGEIDVWDTRPADARADWRAGDLKETLKAHGSPVMAIAFSPSGDVLASGGQDGAVRFQKLDR